MGLEIERKFLVRSEAWREAVRSSAALQQGYLSSNSKATVRVRLFDDARAVLTLKGKAKGITRAEYEYDIPLEEGRELLELARPNVLEKRRYVVEHDGLEWEVDVFEGRHSGLVLAELELSSAEQQFSFPDWLGEEVTHDDRYFNASLARQ